jgi:DNA-binding winged helix-turn-helix (wHTH) protein/tetratricopeptide (TPR) repeat protein
MIHAFGAFELDDGLFELRREGRVVKLPPKTFDLLLYLVGHRDRVVSKAELLDKLWAGEHVTEAVLPTNVSAARAALGDARGRSGMIQTVHGRGYRFVASVEERLASEEARPDVAEVRLFVGRDDVMDELASQLGDCFAGRGRVALLVGEPGIGKTCTAFELVAEARRRGALVLEGHATEGEGAPAFWPWMQALRGMIRAVGSEGIAATLGPGAAELARLLPELRDSLPGLAEPDPLESAQARFRFFDAVTTALQTASRERPLVVFLDDLHWADEPTLLLFEFLAREVRHARVLLLGAYRDVELRRQHPLARVLADLAREPHYRRMPLSGLCAEDVARFIERSTGRPALTGLADAVFRMTEGNPFFVHETVRLLAAEGRLEQGGGPGPSWELGLPEGVREVIGRRLDRLSADCNRALTLAAVVGREFDVPVLERVCELPAGQVLDLLDEAESARIVAPVATSSHPAPPGRYAFSHALVRETLYDELTGPQRVRQHRRVAETLEALGGERSGTHLAELARQFFQAAPGGDVARALDYCVRAGEAALELLAWEEAVAHFERALQAVELAVPIDDEKRCELILALGQAQWQAGQYPEGRRTFSEAAGLARKLERADLLSHAAVGLGGWPQFFADEPPGGPADANRALLEEALEQLPSDALALRSRVLAGLAGHTDMDLRRQHSLEAVELARAAGGADALFDALYARLVALLGPDDTQRRLETATELVELAMRSGRRDRIFMAREARVRSLMLLGDIPSVDRELDACEDLADELRLPIYHHSIARFRLARALGDGRLDDALRINTQVRALGEKSGDWAGELLSDGIEAWVGHMRGASDGLASILDRALEIGGHLGPVLHALGAYFLTGVGRHESARRELEAVARNGFADVPANEGWLISVALAGVSAARLGECEHAQRARELLEPHAGLVVSHQHMRLYLMPVQAVIATASHALGERERALREYEAAIDRCARIGARPAGVAVRRGLAGLLASGRPSAAERKRAQALRAEAEGTARELGIV